MSPAKRRGHPQNSAILVASPAKGDLGPPVTRYSGACQQAREGHIAHRCEGPPTCANILLRFDPDPYTLRERLFRPAFRSGIKAKFAIARGLK
jgi:hypothetical protein